MLKTRFSVLRFTIILFLLFANASFAAGAIKANKVDFVAFQTGGLCMQVIGTTRMRAQETVQSYCYHQTQITIRPMHYYWPLICQVKKCLAIPMAAQPLTGKPITQFVVLSI